MCKFFKLVYVLIVFYIVGWVMVKEIKIKYGICIYYVKVVIEK